VLKNSGWTTKTIKDTINANLASKSFSIPKTTVKLKPDIKRTVEETENVLALLEGSGSLKDEIVIVCGHYDHEGLDVNGDVFNGADDNASGTVAVMTIAKVMKQLKPKRSILFIAFTGEEKGLFGSNYYSRNLLFPIEKTHAVLNIDMIGRYTEEYEKSNIKDYLYVIGPNIMGGDLSKYIEEAKKINDLHIDYKYDNISDPNYYFFRSDHVVFVKEKIPSVFFHSGEHKDYHKVTDDVDKIAFSTFYKRLEMISYFTYLVANSKDKIKVEKDISLPSFLNDR
jgi:Zn-dependent M28 family amino/carboxypeptidase